jgi:hypothetical protein
MLIFKAIRYALAATCFLLPATAVHAWDGVVSGKISALHGVGSSGGAPGNFDFRVQLAAQNVVCNSTVDASFAFINSSEANYKGLMAMLLSAYASGKTVTLYTNKSVQGYCQIGYVVF